MMRRIGLSVGTSSITTKLFISHITVGALTTVLVTCLLFMLAVFSPVLLSPTEYAGFAEDVALSWLMPDSRMVTTASQPDTLNFTPPGYAVIVNYRREVVFTYNATPCEIGERLGGCLPDIGRLTAGETVLERAGERWVEVILPISTGHYVIGYFLSPTPDNIWAWVSDVIGKLPELLTIILLFVVFSSVPASAFLSWLFARPLSRRIGQIALASQRFADGDLAVRVDERQRDDIGLLAHQFNSMADALQQNIHTLRHLLKVNAELTMQAEQDAAQRERLRLSRHLHDDLAQRLFSIAASSAALPELIQRDVGRGIHHARGIAQLTEEALAELRIVLVDLRPGGLLELGLARGLKALCEKWEQDHGIPVSLTLLLRHENFSSALQVTLFRMVQECLNNIAKHAKAHTAQVSLMEGSTHISVRVSDDGMGFLPQSVSAHGRFGLLTMRESIEAFGGSFSVESEPHRGTTVLAELPTAPA
jgi:signal transduction histidine kinase